jgi:hypothetical protein
MGPGFVRSWLTVGRAHCRVLGWVCVGWVVLSCGGSSEAPSQRRAGDPVPDDSFGFRGTRPNTTTPASTPSGSDDDEGAFIEQGCSEAPMRVLSMDCDPFRPLDGCSAGQGCQPYVRYPSAPCEPETYGSRCDWVGDRTQGESCSSEACAAGFLCIATGQGTQCAQICDLSANSTCPAGLVCGSIDIEGIGTCF